MTKNLFLQVCEELHIPHTCSYTNQQFEEHPYKHSLFGLHSLLAEYGIESKGVRFNDKEDAFPNLKVPFLAQVSDDLVLVKSIATNKISYQWYDDVIHITHKQFLSAWSGVALLLYPNKDASEPLYKEHRRVELTQAIKRWGCVACAITILGIAVILRAPQFSLLTILLFILNIIGLYLGYLLLLHQQNLSNAVGDSLCNILKHTTCTNLLDSPAAKAVYGISWSEIGTAYFGVNTIVLILFPNADLILALFSFATFGYIVWSLWYQRFRAHVWCVLCLMVQGVFILQATISLIFIRFSSLGDDVKARTLSFLAVSLLYVASTLSIHFLLAVISKARQAELWRNVFYNFKLRREIFDCLLQKEKHYEVETASSIRFGNPNAAYHLTILTNPYCNPCATMHTHISGMSLNDCCVSIVFTSFGKKYDRVCRLLIAAYQQLGAESAWQLYGKWYTGGLAKDESFFKNLNLDDTTKSVKNEYSKHIEWRKQTGFSATPTILVNGYRMPRPYSIEDFKKLVIT